MASARRSPDTIAAYMNYIRMLASRVASPALVVPADLQQLIAEAEAANSAKVRRAAVRSLFRAAKRAGLVASDPSADLPVVTIPPSRPRTASDRHLQQARHDDPRVDLMIELGARLGLRRAEIARVKSSDLEPSLLGDVLRVIGKGGRERLVPCPADLAERIAAVDGWLFPSPHGGPLSPSRVGVLIADALPGAVTAHWLRHRYGTRTYRLGGRDIRAVQKLLGHSSVATTQIYTEVEDGDLWAAALAA
ncbi:MAG TPA: tyrosine-type recombinase/integrase [Gryllotalpicola sp.]